MNKKGFTLIEIIATVIILALISLLAFPVILNLVKNEETKLSEANRTLIKTAASQYTSEFENAFPKITGNYYCITIEDLVKRDFLINYNDEFNLDTNILITVNQDKKYEYEIMSECDDSKIIPSIVVKNKNGVFNSAGWANKNFYVSIIGTGSGYYKCVSNTECNPDILINKSSGDEYIITEGSNRVCAKAVNNHNESEVVCSSLFKLDTVSPTKPGISVNDLNESKIEVILTTPSNDETSGISHYEYVVTNLSTIPNDSKFISTDTSTLNLTLNSGDRYIYYRSVDNAGNKSDSVRVSLQSGSFDFAINENGKIDIVNMELPNNYVLKYKKGNLTASEVLNNGTDITNSNYFDSSTSDIYTVSAFVGNDEIITKKIYVYNGDALNLFTIELPGITQIGSVLTYAATATASLSGSTLTIDVTDSTSTPICEDGYYVYPGDEMDPDLREGIDFEYGMCYAPDFAMESENVEFTCDGVSWVAVDDFYECPGISYQISSRPVFIGDDNCEDAGKGATKTGPGSYPCSRDPYAPSYEYTIGVEVE